MNKKFSNKTLATVLLATTFFLTGSVYSEEYIYIIHGYGSKSIFMNKISKALSEEGFKVVNFGYKSLSKDIKFVADSLKRLIDNYPETDSISFVSHSMGGIVVRAYIDRIQKSVYHPYVNNIIMLTPPNSGSELADVFADWKILKWILGPNIDHLKTDSASLVHKLPYLENYNVGIITGIRYGKGSTIFKSAHDGMVTVKSTGLGENADYLYVKEGHLSVLYDDKVISQIIYFLNNSSFKKN